MDAFIYQLSLFLNFIVAFFLIIIVILLVTEIWFRPRKNPGNQEDRLKFYRLFMGFRNYDVLLFAIKTISYVFLVWALFFNQLEVVHFLFFLLLQIGFDILAKRPIGAIFNFLNSLFLCFLLFSKQIFYQYLIEVAVVWYIVVLLLLVGAFILFYSSYFYLKDVEFLIRQNKYVNKMKKQKKLREKKKKDSSEKPLKVKKVD